MIEKTNATRPPDRYNYRVLTRLLLFSAFSLTLSGADLAGIWNGQTVDRNGDVQDVSFRFVQSGDTLTGKMYGDNESTPIADARITGNQVTFSVTTELNGSIAKFIYTGAIEGDVIELTRQRVVINVADAKEKGQNKKESIKLKRVT
jgi:hypothetical protein